VKEERVLGLYKGITSPLLTVALMNGLIFASYNFFLRLQCQGSIRDASITQIALAGVGSGIVSAVVTTPTELIKIRQQQCTSSSTARGVVAKIIKTGGFVGLYRGAGATALRDCGKFWLRRRAKSPRSTRRRRARSRRQATHASVDGQCSYPAESRESSAGLRHSLST